jgi:hypothetical protein
VDRNRCSSSGQIIGSLTETGEYKMCHLCCDSVFLNCVQQVHLAVIFPQCLDSCVEALCLVVSECY